MDHDRLKRIEEHAGFAEQRADALDEALRDLGGRLDGVLRRLSKIESRLGVLETGAVSEDGEADPVDDRPPHSGRLPGDR